MRVAASSGVHSWLTLDSDKNEHRVVRMFHCRMSFARKHTYANSYREGRLPLPPPCTYESNSESELWFKRVLVQACSS